MPSWTSAHVRSAMTEILALLSVVGGVVYLFMGGDLLVRGSISLARHLRVSPLVVGATIVAFGTSAPELVVSIAAAARDQGAMALGNILGSNVANVLVVLGAPALIAAIRIDEGAALRAQLLFMLTASVLFTALCLTGTLGRIGGVLLLGLLGAGIALTLAGRMQLIEFEAEEQALERVLGLPEATGWAPFFVLFGAAMLPLGADLAVSGATDLALAFGVSEAVVAASIIAFGTSLPELSVCLIAASQRQASMALGNVIGSNTINLLFVMGATAALAPLPVDPGIMARDLPVMLACAGVLALLVHFSRGLGRRTGAMLLLGYVAYMVLLYASDP